MIRAVLFDVGGPLNTEVEHERLIDADIIAALAAADVAVTPDDYAHAVAFAVHAYAPEAHRAIIWHLVGGDGSLAERVFADFYERAHSRVMPFELREGMIGVIEWLAGLGLKLGLAANQPQATIDVLRAHGVGIFPRKRPVKKPG